MVLSSLPNVASFDKLTTAFLAMKSPVLKSPVGSGPVNVLPTISAAEPFETNIPVRFGEISLSATSTIEFPVALTPVRPGNVTDLRDATRAEIAAVFGNREIRKGWLFDWVRAGKSDVVVCYSGHGVPGLDDRRGYHLPVDGDPNLARITGYPVDLLYDNLAKIPARSVTVYLDACFSGDSPQGMIVRATSGISVTPRTPKAGSKLTVLTAASANQVANWDEETKLGLFTRYLLEALGGLADGKKFGNQDGKVTLAEVKRYLDDEMTYQSQRRYGHARRQTASMQGASGVVLATNRMITRR